MSTPRPIRKAFKTALLCAGLITAAACNPAVTGPIQVPLAFHPGSTSTSAMISTRAKVYVAPVVDEHPAATAGNLMQTPAPGTMPAAGGTVVGQNTQGTNPEPVYDTGATPAVFIHDAMVDQLQHSGVTVVPTAVDADRTVTITLKQFDVTESGNYQATVEATVSVADTAGAGSYTRSYSGDDSTWGKSRSPDNYQQVLTNASTKMIQSFLNDVSFVQAMTK